jgi:uncharacterized protein (TIGR03000 family)
MFRQQATRIGRRALSAAALVLASGLAVSAAPPGGGSQGGGGHGGGGHAGGGFSRGGAGFAHAQGGFHHGNGSAHVAPGGHGGGTAGFAHHGYHSGGYYHHSSHYYPGFYGFNAGYGLGVWDYPGSYPARFDDYFPQYSANAYYPDTYSADTYSQGTYSADAYSPSAAPGGFGVDSPPEAPLQKPQQSYLPDPNSVMIGIRVPPDAEIWFEGEKTSQTGSFREFYSPPLEPDQTYTYEIRVKWIQGGTPVAQTRTIAVRAGQHVGIDFLAPPPRNRPALLPKPETP